MTDRERFIRTVCFEPVDELPFRHAYGLMPGVLDEWHAQGLPQRVRSDRDVDDYFGFPKRARGMPLDIGFSPRFVTSVVEETAEYRIAIDSMGRRTKVFHSVSTIPLALEFPVKDMATWQDYKRRMQFSPERVGSGLEEAVAENLANGRRNSFGTRGFYWFPRDLMGDEGLCIAYYEQPRLVEDICETWCSLIERTLTGALQRVRLDEIHIAEDMAYRNAPMIGKKQFDRFVKPYYERIRRLIEQHGVPVFSVDTDGCLNELVHWFRDCGVNLIAPCEVQAGNDIVAYRKEFGQELAYDGGLDKRVLTVGREAVDAMLERVFPIMKETGGGWQVCLDHRVVPGTPLAVFQHYLNRVRELARF